MARIFVALGLAMAVILQSGLAAAEPVTAHIVDYGIYRVEITQKKQAPSAMDGQAGIVNMETLVLETQTDRIPAKIGVEFGFRYRLAGPASGTKINVVMKALTPGLKPSGGDKLEYTSTVEWQREIGRTYYAGFGFEKDWETVPGLWIIQLLVQDQKMAEKTFTVVRPNEIVASRQIIDLSMPIEEGLPSDPGAMSPRIESMDHAGGAEQMLQFFPGLKKAHLPRGLGWALESLHLTTHSGTYLSAPFRVHPFMDGGRPALTIDQIPLDWCFSDGVLLDFSLKPDGDRISRADVEAKLKQIGYTLKPLDIVLIRTGADAHWGQPSYVVKGAGMTRESTLYLLDRGIKVVGIDSGSWDRPLPYLVKEFHRTGDPAVIWEAHFAGIDKGFCHLEQLTNLGRIPKPFGFKVACFPVKIKGASAGWTRAVAIVDQN